MKNQSNISLAFALVILLFIGQGVFSLIYLNTITAQTENLYQHPYAVSNAARNISMGLISMHRYMKDVVLAENEQKIKIASSLVDEHEQQVLRNFDLIFDRYLGEHRDVQNAYRAFVDWKDIRDNVIVLKTNGKNIEAADITRGKGADHVALLNREAQKLVDFADKKAKDFLDNAVDAKNNAFIVITTLLVATVIATIIGSYHAVRRLISAQKEMKNRIRLIDQNILIAKLDRNGVILDISSHLCRYLGVTKNKIVGQHADFFINDSEGEIQPENIFEIASTGKTWEGELRRVSADGKAQWIHSAVHPELDKNNVVRSYTNIINDITDYELSIKDTLTGLHNRRYFDNVIEKEIRVAQRNRSSLTLAIIDIDYFKKYNDNYGHPAGDSALIKVAQAIMHSLTRPNDYAFRIGGEEFGVIFSGLNSEQSLEFLEMIRDQVEKQQIEHRASDVCKFVTISLGAHINQEPDIIDSNQLYVKADEALYEAKLKRNHVVVT